MSGPGYPSSTEFAVPDAQDAAVIDEVQYGMRFPDGSVRWNSVAADGTTVMVRDIVLHDGGPRLRWKKWLEKQAKAAKVPVYDYANGHCVVRRKLILAVSAMEDHAEDRRPWGALGGTPSAPPVPAPKPPWD